MSHSPAPQGFHDFELLPRRSNGNLVLLPTPVKLLHQGGDVLIYREVRRTETTPTGISKAQNAMFHHLVRSGESPDSDCRFTILCVHGLPGGDREMCVYDYMSHPPEQPEWRPAPGFAVQYFVRDWFQERSGIR